SCSFKRAPVCGGGTSIFLYDVLGRGDAPGGLELAAQLRAPPRLDDPPLPAVENPWPLARARVRAGGVGAAVLSGLGDAIALLQAGKGLSRLGARQSGQGDRTGESGGDTERGHTVAHRIVLLLHEDDHSADAELVVGWTVQTS